MGRRVFMERYPTLEEIIQDEGNKLAKEDLEKVSKERTLYSHSGSWRDTDLDWEIEREIKSKNKAIIDYFKIDESELGRFEIISIGRISNHSSSFAQCSTYTSLYLVLDKNTKIGYYLEHESTSHDERLFS